MTELAMLLNKIHSKGLTEIAKRESPYAYETAMRIIDTGYDLPPMDGEDIEDMKADTMATARALSNPRNWGIKELTWKTAWENLD